jgi:hypothetical protein
MLHTIIVYYLPAPIYFSLFKYGYFSNNVAKEFPVVSSRTKRI